MSGGRWAYKQESLASELFDYQLNCDYGEDGHKQSRLARAINPMDNREISELAWDVLCLIHSCDWYKSGDTGEDAYKADLKWFMDKWLNRSSDDSIKAYKQDIKDFADEIIKEIDLGGNNDPERI